MLRIEGQLRRPVARLDEIGAPWGLIVDADPDGMTFYKGDGFDHRTAQVFLAMTQEEWDFIERAVETWGKEESTVPVPDEAKKLVAAFRYIQEHMSLTGIYAEAGRKDTVAVQLVEIWAKGGLHDKRETPAAGDRTAETDRLQPR